MTELRQREPREECPAFLRFVRRKPCCACHAPAPSQAAHIRMAGLEYGKEFTGMQQKPHDRWAVPLCSSCHLDDKQAQHKGNERKFWARVGINPFLLALTLWGQFVRRTERSPAQREQVVKRARRVASKRTAKLIGPKRKWPSRPIQGKGF